MKKIPIKNLPETELALALSTCHITEATNNRLFEMCESIELDNEMAPDPLPVRFVPHHYGYIFFVPGEWDEESNEWEELETPMPELKHILKYASDMGYHLVKFDRDADKYPELFQSFEW